MLEAFKEIDKSSDENGQNSLPTGWALPPRRTLVRFNVNQKDYLDGLFKQGAQGNHKFDPRQVSEMMKHETVTKDGVESPRFKRTELLNYRKIQSYFSRMKRTMQSQFADADAVAAAEDLPEVQDQDDPETDEVIYKRAHACGEIHFRCIRFSYFSLFYSNFDDRYHR